MDIIGDKLLIYGLGDDGYGCVYFKDEYRQYERAEGIEKGQKTIAKTYLMGNFKEDGFVWKSGGYTTAHDKKRTNCSLSCFKEKSTDSGHFITTGSKNKGSHILGEIEEDLWLVYSFVDHSFATWNTSTNQWRSVNLISRQ